MKVLTFDRPVSLDRTLKSLLNATYYGYKNIDLEIRIDHCESNECLKVLKISQAFKWPYGAYRVFRYTNHVGIQGQWLNCWKEQSSKYVFILEDDVVVSRVFFQILNQLIGFVRDDVIGISLHPPQFSIGRDEWNKWKKIKTFPANVFLYPAVGTWGQLFEAEAWNKFTEFTSTDPEFTKGLITTEWHQKKHDKVWTHLFLEYMHRNRLFNLFVQSEGGVYSGSFKENGLNFEGKSMQEVHLIENKLEINDSLRKFDRCYDEIRKVEYVADAAKDNLIIVAHLESGDESKAVNWACYAQNHRLPFVFLANNTTLPSLGYNVFPSKDCDRNMRIALKLLRNGINVLFIRIGTAQVFKHDPFPWIWENALKHDAIFINDYFFFIRSTPTSILHFDEVINYYCRKIAVEELRLLRMNDSREFEELNLNQALYENSFVCKEVLCGFYNPIHRSLRILE